MDRRAALLALLVLLPLLVPMAGASSGPLPVCGVCGTSFVGAARDHGVPLEIEHSELVVDVGRNGTGRWRAEVDVNASAADRFRENPALLDSIVAEVYAEWRPLVEDPHDLSARTDGSTVVVTFTVPEMAHRGVGNVLLVDYFNSGGTDRYYRLDADRFVLRGPAGTTLVNDPPGATREGGAAVWTADDDYTSFDDGTYVAFGPNRDAWTLTAAQLSIAMDAAPYMADHLVVAASLPTVILAVGLAAVTAVHRRFVDGGSIRNAGGLVALVAAGCLLAVFAFDAADGALGALGVFVTLLSIGIGLVAAVVPERSRDALTLRRLVAITAVPAVLVTAVLAAGFDLSFPGELVTGVAVVLALLLFLPAGYAAGRSREVGRLYGAILLAPAAAVLPMVPIGGFGPGFAAIFLGLGALVGIVGGAVLFHLGWALAARSRTA